MSPPRLVATVAAGGVHGRRRLGGIIATEVRLARRMGVVAAAAAVTVLSAGVVLMLTALGLLFVPVLLVVERVERCDAAMRLSPLRLRERVGVRVGMATVLSVTAAAILTTVAGVSDVAIRLLGVTTSSLLFGLIAYAVLGTSSTLTTFLTRTPLVAVPLITPALASYSDLSDTPLLELSLLTSALHMMAGRMSWSGLGLQLVRIAGVAAVAVASAERPVLDHPATPRRRPARRGAPHHPGRYRLVAAVRSFAWTDRCALTGDALLLMLAVSVPLVALAARLVGSVGVEWVGQRHGIDLTTHLPLL